MWKDLPWQNMILFSYFHKVKYVYWPLWNIWDKYCLCQIGYANLLYLLTFSYETFLVNTPDPPPLTHTKFTHSTHNILSLYCHINTPWNCPTQSRFHSSFAKINISTSPGTGKNYFEQNPSMKFIKIKQVIFWNYNIVFQKSKYFK